MKGKDSRIGASHCPCRAERTKGTWSQWNPWRVGTMKRGHHVGTVAMAGCSYCQRHNIELKGTGKSYKGRWDAVSGTMTGMQSVGREKQRISQDG